MVEAIGGFVDAAAAKGNGSGSIIELNGYHMIARRTMCVVFGH